MLTADVDTVWIVVVDVSVTGAAVTVVVGEVRLKHWQPFVIEADWV